MSMKTQLIGQMDEPKRNGFDDILSRDPTLLTLETILIGLIFFKPIDLLVIY